MPANYTYVPDLLKEARIPEAGCLSRTLHNDDEVRILIYGFAIGEELADHFSPTAAVLHFLQGEAEVTINGDQMSAKPGTLIHMSPNLSHGIIARTPLIMVQTLLKFTRVAHG